MVNQALIWTEDLSVNLMVLDDQHIKLLQVINYWWEKNKSEQITDKEIRKIFKFLTRFTHQHLQFEELMMETLLEIDKSFLSEIDVHKKYHKQFIDSVMASFHVEISSQRGDVVESSKEYLHRVAGWWIPHIKNIDSKYARRIAALSVEDKIKLYDDVVKKMLEYPILRLNPDAFLQKLSKK